MGDDLKYRIETPSDVSGAKKVEEAIAKINEEVSKLNSKSFKDILGKAAEIASIGAAYEGLKTAVEEYAEAQEQVASLDAALAARAQLTDDYRIKLQELAETQQQLTGVKNEDWLKVLTTLTQSGGDAGNIEALVDATKNLAGILGGDLQSAAFAVGKALNGEFNAFTRIGIVIDENATQAEKLNQLWTQLAQRGGGQLEARNETLKGSFRQLGNSTADFFKGIGGGIVEVLRLQTVASGLATSIAWLNGLFGKTIGTSGQLKNAVIATGAAMESAEEITKRFAKEQERLKTAAAEVANQIERETSAIKAYAAEQERIIAAKADDDTKRIDMLEKTGRITPHEAARQRGEIAKKLERDKFQLENQAREEQIKMLETQASGLVGLGDDANEKAMEEQNKLAEMKRLADERAKLAKKLDRNVSSAQYAYDRTQGKLPPLPAGSTFDDITARYQEELNRKQAAKEAAVQLGRAKYDRDYQLHNFDEEHGKLDIASQSKIAQEAEKAARETVTQNLGPKVLALNTQADALRKEQVAELKRHGFEDSAARTEAYMALKEARAKELGDVKRNPDGSYEGTPAGVKHQRDIEKAVNGVQQYPDGDRRNFTPEAQAAIRARDNQIAQLKTIVEGLSKLSKLSAGQDAMLKAALDRIDVLEAVNRLNPHP